MAWWEGGGGWGVRRCWSKMRGKKLVEGGDMAGAGSGRCKGRSDGGAATRGKALSECMRVLLVSDRD
jgi:hypothetical protein